MKILYDQFRRTALATLVCILTSVATSDACGAAGSEREMLLAAIRGSLPDRGCVEALFDVDETARLRGTFGRTLVFYDFGSGAASVVTDRGHSTVRADGSVRRGEPRFGTTVVDDAVALSGPWHTASMIGSFVPAAWSRAMLANPEWLDVERASGDSDEYSAEYLVTVRMRPRYAHFTRVPVLFRMNENGMPISWRNIGEDGAPDGDENFFVYLDDSAGVPWLAQRSGSSRVLLSHSISPSGCSVETFLDHRLESAAIEILQDHERSISEFRASRRAGSDSALFVGDPAAAVDVATDVYSRELRRWRLPLFLVGGLLITAAVVRLILRGKGARG